MRLFPLNALRYSMRTCISVIAACCIKSLPQNKYSLAACLLAAVISSYLLYPCTYCNILYLSAFIPCPILRGSGGCWSVIRIHWAIERQTHYLHCFYRGIISCKKWWLIENQHVNLSKIQNEMFVLCSLNLNTVVVLLIKWRISSSTKKLSGPTHCVGEGFSVLRYKITGSSCRAWFTVAGKIASEI